MRQADVSWPRVFNTNLHFAQLLISYNFFAKILYKTNVA